MNKSIRIDGNADLEKYLEAFEALERIYPRITERKANLGMVGVNARTYIHWRDLGLVGDDYVKGDKKLWVKLNLYEYVWLRTIKTCRDFGIPIDVIKELKSVLICNFLNLIAEDLNGYIDFLTEDATFSLEKISEIKRLSEIAIEHKDEIPPEDFFITTLLGGLVNTVLIYKDEAYIIIYKTKDSFSFGSYTFKSMEGFEKYISEWVSVPHLNIPLKLFIEEFMEHPKNETNLEFWGFINKNEKKVLEALRRKDYKEIVIKKNNDDDIIIEAIMDGNIIEQKAKEIKRLLGLNQYSEITIKFRNEKHLYFKNKTRL